MTKRKFRSNLNFFSTSLFSLFFKRDNIPVVVYEGVLVVIKLDYGFALGVWPCVFVLL